jgi:hypothetical protein
MGTNQANDDWLGTYNHDVKKWNETNIKKNKTYETSM